MEPPSVSDIKQVRVQTENSDEDYQQDFFLDRSGVNNNDYDRYKIL